MGVAGDSSLFLRLDELDRKLNVFASLQLPSLTSEGETDAVGDAGEAGETGDNEGAGFASSHANLRLDAGVASSKGVLNDGSGKSRKGTSGVSDRDWQLDVAVLGVVAV